MKSLSILLIPTIALLVSACASGPSGTVSGYGPGPAPQPGYYWNGTVYVQGQSPYYHSGQYNQTNVDVNRTNVNRTNVNDINRTNVTDVNRTNVNDVNRTNVTDVNRKNVNNVDVKKTLAKNDVKVKATPAP